MKKEKTIMTIIFTLQSAVIFTVGFFIGDINGRSSVNESKSWKDVGGNIDIEYYLEVTPDSIYIENYGTHQVHGGKYSDLYDLILMDNLK